MAAILTVSMMLFAWSTRFAAAFAMPKLLVLAAGLVPLVAAARRADARGSLLVPGAFWLLVLLACAAGGLDPWVSLIGRYNSYADGVLCAVLALAYNVLAACVPAERRDDALHALTVAGVFLGLHAWAQAMGLDSNLSEKLDGHRAISTIGSPTDLGMLLATFLPLALARNPLYAVPVAVGLAATGSRGGWIAGAVGLAAFALRVPRLRRAAGVGLVALAVAGAFVALRRDRHAWGNSDRGRVQLWRVAWSEFKAHPWLGAGTDCFELVLRARKPADFVAASNSGTQVQADAHDDVLEVASTLGLLGLAGYAALLFAIWRRVRADFAVRAALLALWVNMKFNPLPLEGLMVGAVLCGLAARERQEFSAIPLRVRLAGVLAAAALAAGVARMAYADYQAQVGTVAALSRACEINPVELQYKVVFSNAAVAAFNATRDAELRLLLLGTMRREAGAALRYRPAQATSWYIAGFEAQAERAVGVKREPCYYYARGRDRDPLNAALVDAGVSAGCWR